MSTMAIMKTETSYIFEHWQGAPLSQPLARPKECSCWTIYQDKEKKEDVTQIIAQYTKWTWNLRLINIILK